VTTEAGNIAYGHFCVSGLYESEKPTAGIGPAVGFLIDSPIFMGK